MINFFTQLAEPEAKICKKCKSFQKKVINILQFLWNELSLCFRWRKENKQIADRNIDFALKETHKLERTHLVLIQSNANHTEKKNELFVNENI